MRKIRALALHTLRQNMRNRMLNLILLFSLIILMSVNFFSFLAPSAEGKFIKDIGLSCVMFFSVLITVFAGASLIPEEIEQRTIVNILSKPVRRIEYLIGRFMGLVMVFSLNYLVMLGVFCLVLLLKGVAITVDLFTACVLGYFALAVLASVVLAVSTRASMIVNVTAAVFVYIIGNMTQYTLYLKERVESTLMRLVLDALYYTVPNFTNFNVTSAVVLGQHIPLRYVAQNACYAALYIGIMLGVAFLLFNEREV